ncbi:MAG TPA: hypothetical protein VN830_05000 [Verrucomicrobiae bacterium]|nr:hypothetical protein [Verrucomicrobiae bacterium]
MQTVYYIFMRKLCSSLLLPLLTVCLVPALAGQQAEPVRAPIQDSHEGMTIGVDPWTQASRYKERFPKKSPFSKGIVALRVSFRNDTGEGIKIDFPHIRLLLQLNEDERQELEPLTADDVADTVLLKNNGKDPTAKRIPLPIPIGGAKPTRDKNWTDFRDDCQNAGMPSSVVAAHGTVEGLLYFDLRGEVELLRSARLYVPNLTTMGTKQPLSYFEIPLGSSPTN